MMSGGKLSCSRISLLVSYEMKLWFMIDFLCACRTPKTGVVSLHFIRPTINRTIFRNYVIVLLTWMGHTLELLCGTCKRRAHDKCQRKWHVRALIIISICACAFSSHRSQFNIVELRNVKDLWEVGWEEFSCTKLMCLWRIRLLCWIDRQVVCVCGAPASACAFHLLEYNLLCVSECGVHQSFVRFLDFIIIFFIFLFFFCLLFRLRSSLAPPHSYIVVRLMPHIYYAI